MHIYLELKKFKDKNSDKVGAWYLRDVFVTYIIEF